MFLGFPFIIPFSLIDYLSIHAHITCIVYDLGALIVALKILITGFLQSDEFHQSVVDFLKWNVESTSKLDYDGASNPMDPSGSHFELMTRFMRSWIGSRFTLAHKGVLVISKVA